MKIRREISRAVQPDAVTGHSVSRNVGVTPGADPSRKLHVPESRAKRPTARGRIVTGAWGPART